MATFFCSDPHAFHGNIMKYCRRLSFLTDDDRTTLLEREELGGDAVRDFRVSEASIVRMNEGLAANVNARVGENDVLWCLGDWCFGRGESYLRHARWFRDASRCRTVNLVWGNHDDYSIRDLFHHTYEQVSLHVDGVSMTLNHYPMVTWNGQHHASVSSPNIHLYGHVHGVYQTDPASAPLKDSAAWPALDVGFDGHGYQVWSVPEILAALRPRLLAFEELRRERNQFDPFRGRGHRTPGV